MLLTTLRLNELCLGKSHFSRTKSPPVIILHLSTCTTNLPTLTSSCNTHLFIHNKVFCLTAFHDIKHFRCMSWTWPHKNSIPKQNIKSVPSNLAQIAYQTKLDINLTTNDFKWSYDCTIYFLISFIHFIYHFIQHQMTIVGFAFQSSNLEYPTWVKCSKAH